MKNDQYRVQKHSKKPTHIKEANVDQGYIQEEREMIYEVNSAFGYSKRHKLLIFINQTYIKRVYHPFKTELRLHMRREDEKNESIQEDLALSSPKLNQKSI